MSQPIREIMVIGIGGIGGVVGARLSRAAALGGRRITFVARGPHLQAIRSGGLRLIRPGGEALVVHPDLATDSVEEAPRPDLAVICVKSYDLQGLADRLAPRVGDSTVVLPLLNGADIRERLRERIAGGILPPACIYVSARRGEPGVVEHVGGPGLVHLGPDPVRPEWRGLELLELFRQAEVPFQWHEQPTVAVWTKYLFIASFALVTAAHRADFGRVLSDPALSAQARQVMEEICAVARARGIDLPKDAIPKTFAAAASFPPQTRTSYQRDIEGRSPADEGDLYAGTILPLGRSCGVPTPVSAELAAAIQRLKT